MSNMKVRIFLLSCITLIICSNLSVFNVIAEEINANTLYVMPEGAGACTSWGDPCELQYALSIAQTGDQIWAAAGIYYPTDSTDRDFSFSLVSGVAIYGGFLGTEDIFEERNWETNITILSGDIGTPGVIEDNSRHVVTGINLDSTTTMDGFTITAGNATSTDGSNRDGGGLFLDNSNPTLTHLIFTGNTAHNNGGGLYNVSGSPTLVDVTFTGNASLYWWGGGMCSIVQSNPILIDVTFNANSAVRGGGLFVYQSSASLNNISFTDNTATYGGGLGTGYYGIPVLTDVVFSGNDATYGGGMYNENFSGGQLTRVGFSENIADYGGGMNNYASSSPSLADVTFTGNIASMHGGGIYNKNSSPIIATTSFIDNHATQGAGVFNENSASPSFVDVRFSNNSADNGGGIYNLNSSNPSLTNITFDSNTAVYSGGGLYNFEECSPILTNITFSANTAGSHGGGVYNYDNSNPILTNVTISTNSALFDSGGIYNYDSNPILMNAILWGNSPDQIFNTGSSLPTVTYSLIQDGCPTGSDCSEIIQEDPLLGTLGDNGGFTFTHALGEGSPAIDTGDPDPAACPATDQRWIARPIDGDAIDGARCDIGAYEYAFLSLEISILGSGSVNKVPDKTTYEYGENVLLTAISAPGWLFSGWNGDLISHDNPLAFTISDHTQLVATFIEDINTVFLPLIIK
jgi:hypothetical protein